MITRGPRGGTGTRIRPGGEGDLAELVRIYNHYVTGTPVTFAGVTLPNEASERLHLCFGFQTVGVYREVGRKFDRFWDVAWFQKPLSVPRG